MKPRVAIVGAGLAGLALAHELRSAGVEVRVFEASDRAGGVIRSEKHDTFLLELGPNSLMNKPGVSHLVSRLRIEDEVISPRPETKNRFLAKRLQGSSPKLIAAPRSIPQAIRSPILSSQGKMLILSEPLSSRSKAEDESVHSVISNRFGAEVAEEIVAPMLGGIWAADLKRLSCRSALPMLWKSHSTERSLLVSALRKLFKKTSGPTKARPKLQSFVEGMETLPKRLAEALPLGCIRFGAEVRALHPEPSGVRLQWRDSLGTERQETFEHVALCCAALPTARLVQPLDRTLARAIESVPYAPLGVLHVAFPKEDVDHLLNGFGFLVPPSLEHALLGSVFSSSLFEGRAPEDTHLLTCFAGGSIRPEFANVGNGEVAQRVVRELSALIGARSEGRILAKTEWSASIPNYPVGHFHLQESIESFVSETPQLSILGNWYKGISLTDRIDEASLSAKGIVIALEQQSDTSNSRQTAN